MTNQASLWKPDLDQLREIHHGSSEVVKRTPVFSFGELSRRCGGKIQIKAENLQRTGSFKLRGALSKLRDAEARKVGVVAGSAGNHGQALAYAARHHGVPCTVFMPELAAIAKVDAVEAFGAEVRQVAGSVDECVAAARAFAEAEGFLFVHPFDDLDVVKGQAGLGLELGEQVPDLARVIVPIGGGGLISGVAAALKAQRPEIEIFGVQAAGCASFPESLERGEPVEVSLPGTIADGIAVKRPGELTLGLVERWVDDVVVVDDDAIAEAMVLLVERAKLVAEGAGAAGVAALCAGKIKPAEHGSTALVISGGNVDAHVLAAVIGRHQTGAGRRTRLFMTISDRPGGLAEMLRALAATGANVLDVTHVRDGVPLHVGETGIEILVECRGRSHRDEMLKLMNESGYAVEEIA